MDNTLPTTDAPAYTGTDTLTHTLTLCHVEQAEQTAYWMYDNLLTILLRLERNDHREVNTLLNKVSTMYHDLGTILKSINPE